MTILLSGLPLPVLGCPAATNDPTHTRARHMRSIRDIDWDRWTPQQRATLLFILRDDQVLLIHKKRGLGAGNINGPGGRIEPGETPLAAAIRETREEVGVTPLNPEACGELRFQFLDGLSIHVHVFKAATCEGQVYETDEAIPLWTPLDAIPFERMWADDALWLPLLLADQKFRGYFLFDGHTMLDHLVHTSDEGPHPQPASRANR